jgi:hypothetical protein
MGDLWSPAGHERASVLPSGLAHGAGEFRELPGPPPDVDARRQAFRAVLRRLLCAPPQDPEPTAPEHNDSDDEERPDEAA